jgi:Concanavalin A-like lectin/glucanases superfamily
VRASLWIIVLAATLAPAQELEKQLAAAESAFAGLRPEIERAQAQWEKTEARSAQVDWTISRGIVVQRRLAGANSFNGKRVVDVDLEQEGVAQFGLDGKFTLSAWVRPAAPSGVIVRRGMDVAEGPGYSLCLKDGKAQVNLVKSWLDDALRVETERPIELNQWQHVAMTYDGSRVAAGVRIYVDGQPQKLKVILDHLTQSFESKADLWLGGGAGPDNNFRGQMRDVRIYKVALTPDEAAVLATDTPVSAIAQIAPEKRTRAEAEKIALYFLDRSAPPRMREAWRRVLDLRQQEQKR